ncbi:MAG: toxin-antitoxin system HicB family antitoxin [Peptoanaerobacter stomatis]
MGEKEKLKAIAEQQGQSLNAFINKAIEERIERDI